VAAPHGVFFVVKEELPALEITFALVEPHHHGDVTLLQVILQVISSLVGGIPTPLKNMKVSWDFDIPNIWKKNMFQSTNQIISIVPPS